MSKTHQLKDSEYHLSPQDVQKVIHAAISFRNRCILKTFAQTTMPFGIPEDVSLSVAKMCREVGKGGGFIISPTHSINEDVPWENIVAFYEATEEFGVYQGGGKQ